MISKRSFLGGLVAVPFCPGIAHSADEAFVSIIDSPSDTRTWIDKIASSNVEIIGRYYSRGFQSSLPDKRISENGDEAKQLLDHGLAILSEYQYGSSEATKFLFGAGKITGLRGMDHAEVARHEAKLDADAARDQAGRIGQPQKTAIYFGLDFNLHRDDRAALVRDVKINGKDTTLPIVYTDGTHVKNTDLKAACIAYFAELNRLLSDKYLIGLYGNGFASRLLREQPKPLIAYTWLSGSLGYDETADVLRNTNDWHLFQNQLDRTWFGICGKKHGKDVGIDIDTNIQNPQHPDIGAWKRDGLFRSSTDRLKAIVDARKVAKTRTTLIDYTTAKPALEMICFDKKLVPADPIKKSKTVRVIGARGDWLDVDVDDDGQSDGVVPKGAALGIPYRDLP